MNRDALTFLPDRERQAVEAFVRRVLHAFPQRVKRVTLFGSKARRRSEPDSDIDLLVLADSENWRFCHAISDIASDVSLCYGVLLDPHVIDQTRWERMQKELFILCENVQDEGIALFSGA